MRTTLGTVQRTLVHAASLLALLTVTGLVQPTHAAAGIPPCSEAITLIKGADSLVKVYENRGYITPTESYDLRTFNRWAKKAIAECRLADARPDLDAFIAYTIYLRDVRMALTPAQADRLIVPINGAIVTLGICTCSTALTAEAGDPSPAGDEAAAAPAACDKGLALLNLLRVTVKDWRNLGILTVEQYGTMDTQLVTAHQNYLDCQVADALQQVRNFEKYAEWLYRTGVLDRRQANELLDLAAQAAVIISTCGC